MDPLAEVAPGDHVARRSLDFESRVVTRGALVCEPARVSIHEGLSRRGRRIPLVERLLAVRDIHIEKLANVRTIEIARRRATEERRGCDFAGIARPELGGERVQVSDGGSDQRISCKIAVWYVDRQQ